VPVQAPGQQSSPTFSGATDRIISGVRLTRFQAFARPEVTPSTSPAMTGWWNSAMQSRSSWITHASATRRRHNTVFANTFDAAQKNLPGVPQYQFYDDEGWWALAWIEHFTTIGDYLSTPAESSSPTLARSGMTPAGAVVEQDKEYRTRRQPDCSLSVAAHLAKQNLRFRPQAVPGGKGPQGMAMVQRPRE